MDVKGKRRANKCGPANDRECQEKERRNRNPGALSSEELCAKPLRLRNESAAQEERCHRECRAEQHDTSRLRY